VLIGGFHLMKRPLDGALIDCARRLDAYETEYYTCHCTGAEQFEYMKPYMRRLHYASTGDIIIQ
jgi:7,8-dihydropterin-6-yl-methyl-4-(beta-D-ribofuranosyl)aminobenzene 5'-phosphate synthase